MRFAKSALLIRASTSLTLTFDVHLRSQLLPADNVHAAPPKSLNMRARVSWTHPDIT